LQNAMIDAGDRHLRNHQLRRTNDLLHPDRHVLNVVVVAFPRELELPESSDMEVHVGETRPRVVAGTKQHRRLDLGAIAHAKRARRRTGDALLQIPEMDRRRCVSARAVPILEYVRVAIDDHDAAWTTTIRRRASP